MKYLAAYMLLQLGGETSPKADGIKKVLSSVGIETDDERLNKLISELEGKNIQEVSRYYILNIFMCLDFLIYCYS